LLVVTNIQAASAASSQSSFEFALCVPQICAPPLRPSCVERDATYGDDKSILSCQDQVTRYAENINAYRACLLQEVQRVIVDINKTADRFKCRTTTKRACP
jgi:hypothetical protein